MTNAKGETKMSIVKKDQSSGTLPAVMDQKSTIVRVATVGGGVAILALALPVISSALMGALGLLGLGVAAIIGIGTFKLLPFLGQKWENKVLGLRKQEARTNPIEQLESGYIKREQGYNAFISGLKIIGREVKGMSRMIEEREKTDPTHDLSVLKKSHKAMVDFYNTQIAKAKVAEEKLEAFKKFLEQKRFEYSFAQTGQAVLQNMKDAQGADPVGEILTEEAVKSITSQFDEVFATVELESVLNQAKQIQSRSGGLEAIEADFEVIKQGKGAR